MIVAGTVLALWFLTVTLDEDLVQDGDGGPHLYAYDSQSQCEEAIPRLQQRPEVVWVGTCRPGPGAPDG